MRAAFGGGLVDFTDSSLDRLQNTYHMVEGQLVEQDLAPHKEVVDRLHARGMKAIYNVEAIWINSGFNVNADISGYRAQLQAIKNAGWDGLISEGLSQKQVSVLREYLPYYNEGGEMAEDVYSGGMYYRPTSMADGNYLECYHFGVNYDPAFSSASQSTPDNMGVTFMLYTTASLEMNPAALTNYVDSLLNRSVKIKTMTFWVGFGQSALNKLDSDFNFLWNALNKKYNFTVGVTPGPTPSAKHTPHIWCGMVNQPDYYKTNVQLGSNVGTSGRQGWLDTTTNDWAKPESLTADEKAALTTPVSLGSRDASGKNAGIATVTPKSDGSFSATILSPSAAGVVHYNWKGATDDFGVEMVITWTVPLPTSNSIAKIVDVTFQYQVNSFVKIQGSARDAAGNGTSRPVGLWENINGKMVSQKQTKSSAKDNGYFDFVISDLASGNHFFRLQTDDNYTYPITEAFNLRR